MMLFKKISIIFLMVFVACGASEGDVEVTENISSNSSEPTTSIEQEKENDDSSTCLLYTSPSPRD